MEDVITPGASGGKGWRTWTLQVKVWKLLLSLAVAAVLLMVFAVVHQDDEILALVRNEVVTTEAGQRTWKGGFVNTHDTSLRDVAVIVDFVDGQDRKLGRAEAEAVELPPGRQLDLQAPLPAGAARIRVYSVQWRMGRKARLMGPFREPWEFGYLMADPAHVRR